MTHLNPHHPKIKSALRKHLSALLPELEKRIAKESAKGNYAFLNNVLKPQLVLLLSGSPNELINLHGDISSDSRYSSSITSIKAILSYQDWFVSKKKTKYDAYNLAENLNIQTCAYCNRIYTKTVIKPNKVTRPSFDHWFSKDDYPLLALSFYNLIPCCSICNSGVKGSHPFTLQEHLHPYVDIDCGYHFSYYNKKLNSYEFKIKADDGNVKAKNTVEAFKLRQIYETHLSDIKDLVRLRNVYSQNYLMNLHKFLNKDKTNVSMDEIYRLAFGTFINEVDFDKRPLSKMKRDILTELGII